MSKLKVNVVIAGRSYPLSVQNAKEEEGLRAAAKKINKLILQYEENYAVSDKQDVLAMCALQFASSSEVTSLQTTEDTQKATEKIDELVKQLESHLQ